MKLTRLSLACSDHRCRPPHCDLYIRRPAPLAFWLGAYRQSKSSQLDIRLVPDMHAARQALHPLDLRGPAPAYLPRCGICGRVDCPAEFAARRRLPGKSRHQYRTESSADLYSRSSARRTLSASSSRSTLASLSPRRSATRVIGPRARRSFTACRIETQAGRRRSK